MQYNIVLRICLNVTEKIKEMITQGKQRARADSLAIQVCSKCIICPAEGFDVCRCHLAFLWRSVFLYVFFAIEKEI